MAERHGGAPPRIALVGCGRWGRYILRDLLALGSTVVVADPAAAARAHGAAAGVATFADVAQLPDVDGIVVATPTGSHATVLETLLPRGVPTLCEKPLTADAASAERVAARGAGRLFVMDKWRYHPGIEALRDLAAGGELGPLRGLRTTRIGWVNPHADVDAVWILAPHDLSIALEVLGEIPTPRRALGERLDGSAVGLFGVLGDDPWMALDVSVARPEQRREVCLYCRDAIAVLPGAYSEHLWIVRSGGAEQRRPISTEPPLRRELQAFLAHLGGGPPPKSSAADGVAIVQALERLRALAGLTNGAAAR
jgi:predicted dehydrogenase